METNILYCKQFADQIKMACRQSVWFAEKTHNRTPHLCVVQVGDNPASTTYVKNKETACEYVGIRSTIMKLEESITEDDLIVEIEKLNCDDDVTAILVQLPLPKHIDENAVLQTILPIKDADGFTIYNNGLSALDLEGIDPCTPAGVMEVLEESGIEIAGKHAVVIGRSNIVGKPMARLLLNADATVTMCHSKTENLESFTKQADILVVAVGKAKFIKNPEAIKKGAVIIDVGINRDENGKLCGDVDTEAFMGIASHITPVPKGIGVMTVAMLMANTVRLFGEQLKNSTTNNNKN